MYWLALYVKVTNLSFASEQMHAHNFVVFYLQTTPTVSGVLRSRSPYRSLPPRSIRRMLTQRRGRPITDHRHSCRLLWAPTTIDDDGLTDLLITSL